MNGGASPLSHGEDRPDSGAAERARVRSSGPEPSIAPAPTPAQPRSNPSPGDYEEARAYALGRLARDLSPVLLYHSLEHTRDDVLPAAERLAALSGVGPDDLLLLRTAACYHDIGFTESFEDHELHSVRIALDVLPRYGYTPAQLDIVRSIILATNGASLWSHELSRPHTLLEALMVDADLDVLGRDDFCERNQALRAELASLGHVYSEREWYASQLRFLQAHRYWTAAARSLRDAGKQHNVAQMQERVHSQPRP